MAEPTTKTVMSACYEPTTGLWTVHFTTGSEPGVRTVIACTLAGAIYSLGLLPGPPPPEALGELDGSESPFSVLVGAQVHEARAAHDVLVIATDRGDYVFGAALAGGDRAPFYRPARTSVPFPFVVESVEFARGRGSGPDVHLLHAYGVGPGLIIRAYGVARLKRGPE